MGGEAGGEVGGWIDAPGRGGATAVVNTGRGGGGRERPCFVCFNTLTTARAHAHILSIRGASHSRLTISPPAPLCTGYSVTKQSRTRAKCMTSAFACLLFYIYAIRSPPEERNINQPRRYYSFNIGVEPYYHVRLCHRSAVGAMDQRRMESHGGDTATANFSRSPMSDRRMCTHHRVCIIQLRVAPSP